MRIEREQARCLPELYAEAGLGDPARHPEKPVHLLPTVTWREVAEDLALPGWAFNRLSPAEQVVLAHLRQGLSNREIANALGKSERTVKNQVSAILAKCGVPTRARLIALLR